MKTITISVINDLATDQRVGRMAETLSGEGFEIQLIGRRLPGSLPPPAGFRVRRFRMLFRRGPFFYVFFNIRLFFYLLFRSKVVLYTAVDLDTLPASYLAARIRRIPILYDSHEYFTEVPELADRPRTRGVWKKIEALIVPHLSLGIAVSDHIATAYQEEYGTGFITIRNVSRSGKPETDDAFSSAYPSKYRVIYQGALNMGRGLELMIDAMQWMQDTVLFIVGDGDIRDELQERVFRLKLTDRVVFPGRVPPAQLFSITSQCHLGLSLEEDLGLNYRYALPNKIFDYIQARVPVLCSDLPEMAALISSHGVGEVCRSREPAELAFQMKEMLRDETKRVEWKLYLEEAARQLCWENEESKLKEVVSKILAT